MGESRRAATALFRVRCAHPREDAGTARQPLVVARPRKMVPHPFTLFAAAPTP
jgi:hypothetical protein